MSLTVPPGWPPAVRPPQAPRWELTAEAWLLDQCPPEYRTQPALRRHLLVLARFAAVHVEGMQVACRRGRSGARAELRDLCPPDVIDAAVEVWLVEDARLAALRREVGLVEAALRAADGG